MCYEWISDIRKSVFFSELFVNIEHIILGAKFDEVTCTKNMKSFCDKGLINHKYPFDLRGCMSECTGEENCQYIFYSEDGHCNLYDNSCGQSDNLVSFFDRGNKNGDLRCVKTKMRNVDKWEWELISDSKIKGSVFSRTNKSKLHLAKFLCRMY